jgi:hypothetical protein
VVVTCSVIPPTQLAAPLIRAAEHYLARKNYRFAVSQINVPARRVCHCDATGLDVKRSKFDRTTKIWTPRAVLRFPDGD